MSRKFLTALDLTKNELQNAVVQNLASAPSSPVKGQIYMGSVDNTLYWYNGTSWVSAAGGGTGFPGYGSVAPETVFGSASTDGASASTSRADHKHGNPAHDAAAHAAISISSLAVPTGDVPWNAKKITGLANPSVNTDAANKQYVDDVARGLDAKSSVVCATVGNIVLSNVSPATIDGVALTEGMRVLVKNQTAPAENGIYWATNSPPWVLQRDGEMDNWLEVPGAFVFVERGTVNADTGWVSTADAGGTLGTTPITWTQFSSAGAVVAGNGLTQSGQTINVQPDASLTAAADLLSVNYAGTGSASTAAKSDHNHDATYVNVPGDSMTGTLSMGGAGNHFKTMDTVQNLETRMYGDRYGFTNAVGAYYSYLTCDPGNSLVSLFAAAGYTLSLSAPKITVSQNPATATEVANKAYVDAQDAAIGAKRFAVACSAAVSTVVTHNLNTKDVIVQVYRIASPFDQVECDVEHTSTTQVTVRFTTAPAAGDYQIVVLG